MILLARASLASEWARAGGNAGRNEKRRPNGWLASGETSASRRVALGPALGDAAARFVGASDLLCAECAAIRMMSDCGVSGARCCCCFRCRDGSKGLAPASARGLAQDREECWKSIQFALASDGLASSADLDRDLEICEPAKGPRRMPSQLVDFLAPRRPQNER